MYKKKLIGFLAILTIAAIAAFNVNVNSKETGLSDISLANAEALAGEHPLGDCVYAPWDRCELLDPTDPNKDQSIYHWRW